MAQKAKSCKKMPCSTRRDKVIDKSKNSKIIIEDNGDKIKIGEKEVSFNKDHKEFLASAMYVESVMKNAQVRKKRQQMFYDIETCLNKIEVKYKIFLKKLGKDMEPALQPDSLYKGVFGTRDDEMSDECDEDKVSRFLLAREPLTGIRRQALINKIKDAKEFTEMFKQFKQGKKPAFLSILSQALKKKNCFEMEVDKEMDSELDTNLQQVQKLLHEKLLVLEMPEQTVSETIEATDTSSEFNHAKTDSDPIVEKIDFQNRHTHPTSYMQSKIYPETLLKSRENWRKLEIQKVNTSNSTNVLSLTADSSESVQLLEKAEPLPPLLEKTINVGKEFFLIACEDFLKSDTHPNSIYLEQLQVYISNSTETSTALLVDKEALALGLLEGNKLKYFKNEASLLFSKGKTENSASYVEVKLTLAVVTREMFEQALQACRGTLQASEEVLLLTHINIFPSDIRMFIRLPVLQGSQIDEIEQKSSNR